MDVQTHEIRAELYLKWKNLSSLALDFDEQSGNGDYVLRQRLCMATIAHSYEMAMAGKVEGLREIEINEAVLGINNDVHNEVFEHMASEIKRLIEGRP